MKLTPDGVASYAGAAASLGAGMSLNDIGVLVGIGTALATFAVNTYFNYRRTLVAERMGKVPEGDADGD